ncbi:MAG: tRNA (adenosine(37)-N6)-threonylcarbamoyltransferase complex ATPase subunit type 1 TsaE, partial [Anaerolineae bacterium]|nr:tRNA (adenosine(37)-N6)-threonylcarbamoyltransferase complex ATPase subunit type 1 TsaE [Anaerolineae bacterium]
ILDGRGPVIIEWPEQIEAVIPKNHLWVTLRVLEATRRNLILEGSGAHYEKLIEQFREATFGI